MCMIGVNIGKRLYLIMGSSINMNTMGLISPIWKQEMLFAICLLPEKLQDLKMHGSKKTSRKMKIIG